MKTTVLALVSLTLIVVFSGCQSGVEQVEETVQTLEATTSTVEETSATSVVETTSTTEASVPEGDGGKTSTEDTSVTSTTYAGGCVEDSDCPAAFTSSRYCWTGQDSWGGDEKNVYVDSVEYVCSGKGTASARCAEVRRRIPVDRCVASKCFNGECYPTHCFNRRVDDMEEGMDCGIECPDCMLTPNITCYNDCDCMSNEGQTAGRYYRSCLLGQIQAGELADEGSCRDRNIYQNLVYYKCVKPGTGKSRCESSFAQQMLTASCRDRNCTLDCKFRTMPYPNIALLNNRNVSFTQ